ncbi:hypothetical protein BsIDN1_70900 [Bacillus safensis]|uniref:ABC transporter domain-containing protein n=1 Tax=Bacillus safensis TaxID=561879 RepID=A0A5S9MLB2_BACIA|nr:hypothetical protein BsIDN1_70900 [Bacillus safensis]
MEQARQHCLRCFCAFEKPTKGSILLNGDDITGDTIKQRSERIGVVMQNPNQMISKQMIFDEVALGLVLRGVKEDEIKERVERVLKVCGLYPFRNWPVSALSFGQKKKKRYHRVNSCIRTRNPHLR